MKLNRHPLASRVALMFVALAAGCSAPEGTQTPGLGQRDVQRGIVAVGPTTSIAPTMPTNLTTARPTAWNDSVSRVAPVASPVLDARLLVLSADGNEPTLGAIRQALDYVGVPYTVWIARDRPGALTAAVLSNGLQGAYQGVILATDSLVYSPDGATWASALTPAEWQSLWDYESAYGVRQITWYTWPVADLGFQSPSALNTSVTPLTTTLTAAGRATFPTLNPSIRFTIRDAYTYLARPVSAAGVTPLLVDANGNALALARDWTDGRQNIALTFDSSVYTPHIQVLAYGLINWVTRGLFLGERHAYAGVQVDDFFLGNVLWSGGVYRLNALDLTQTRTWQASKRLRPVTADLRLDMVFNAEGATGIYSPDTLTPAARLYQGDFKWINHTFTHENLNAVTYAVARSEIGDNITTARTLGLRNFNAANLVTGEISGLRNPEAMRAAFDLGVRYVVSDSSRPEGAAPSPNAGKANAVVPAIFEVPRRPTNLFFNVSTPAEWTGEYNQIYRAFWGRDLTYAELIERESDVLVQYLVRGETSPWMFHQANLRAYDGRRSLLTDLLDATFTRYEAIMSVPVLSPTFDTLAARVIDRTNYNQCNATGAIRPGQSLTLHVDRDCTVPVTGAAYGTTRETYAGQAISYVRLRAGETLTVPLR